MDFILFNSYPTYQPFGRDWTVSQLEAAYINYGEVFPIDGDAMAVAINRAKK